jgi:DNA-binding LacI/PurR family transcriptional regulator
VHRETEFGLIPTVDSDRRNGMLKVVNHLVELGHKKIAFMGGYNEEGDCATLLSGFMAGMEMAGLAVRKEFVLDGRYCIEGGYNQTLALLKSSLQPTAIACANDFMACGALRAIKGRGLSVPHDIAVTGFDNSKLAQYSTPSLTSVDLCVADVGSTVANTIAAMLKKESVPAMQVYPTRLVKRESTLGSL